MVSFIANPDRYGRFGHQSFSMLTAWALAAILDKKFVPLQYLYFERHFNSFVDFGRSKYSTSQSMRPVRFSHIRGASIPDQYVNNRLPVNSTDGLISLLDQISEIEQDSADVEICAFLPFDQNIGILGKIIDKNRDDLRRIFHFDQLFMQYSDLRSPIRVVIHIRRGDVSSQAHPTWHVPISIYYEVIIKLMQTSNNRCSIDIVSDGPPYSTDVALLAERHGIELKNDRVRCKLDTEIV